AHIRAAFCYWCFRSSHIGCRSRERPIMKRRIGLMVVLAAANSASAELVYDGFAYTAGSNVAVQADPTGVPFNTNPLDANNLALPNAINPCGPHWYGAGQSTLLVTVNGTGLTAPTGLPPA